MPVPAYWLITDQNFVAFSLMNTAPTFLNDGKLHTTAVVDVFPFPKRAIGSEGLARWLSVQRQWLAHEAVESVEEKTLKFGDESITCIGGKELSAISLGKPGVPQMDVISLDCMSDHGLNILFVGEPSDVPSFYTFLSEVRRKS